MSLTIVMYHYVRDTEKTDFPKIKALSVAQFLAQVEKLEKEYTFVSLDDVRLGKKLPENSCILSFDDGLKDHYQNVFPILKEKNISGAFFPITCSFDGVVADVHKIHLLLAKVGTEELVARFHGFMNVYSRSIQQKFIISKYEKIDLRYRFDDNLTANLKYTLNNLPEEIRTNFLQQAFNSLIADSKGLAVGDEAKFAANFYLSSNEIKEMSRAGMIFGSHTYSHRRLNILSEKEQKEELTQSKNFLEELIGDNKVFSLSYPFGSYNDFTLEIAQELGYSIALGTEVGVNEDKLSLFALKRLNANEI